MDRDYTHGIGFEWIFGKNRYRDPSPDITDQIYRPVIFRATSIRIHQSIYTPGDLRESKLITDDRPYAGYLSIQTGRHGYSTNSLSSINIELGLTGPVTASECIQKKIHDWIDSPEPKGWKHQLPNEAVLNIHFDHRRRLLMNENRSPFFDLIPRTGVSMGTGQTNLRAGGLLRFGRFPDRFGRFIVPTGRDAFSQTGPNPASRSLDHRCGLYFFIDLEGKMVVRDMFLDGTAFRSSHRIRKHILRGSIQVGAGCFLGRTLLSMHVVSETKSFPDQKKAHGYVSFSLAIRM